jgi:hypothetical protein
MGTAITRKTNILHIRDSQGIYGAERVLLTIGKNIDKTKFNFYLLCMQRDSGVSQDLIYAARKMGINVLTIRVHSRIDIAAIRELRKILRIYQIDIINTHDYKSDLYGLISAVGLKIIKILTAHGSTKDSFIKKVYLFVTENVTYRFYDHIIAVSQDLYDNLSKHIRPKKISLIQNGIDMIIESVCHIFGYKQIYFLNK